MAKEPLHNLPVRLTESNYARVKEMANAQNISMNNLINRLIEHVYEGRFLAHKHSLDNMNEQRRELEEQLAMVNNQINSIW